MGERRRAFVWVAAGTVLAVALSLALWRAPLAAAAGPVPTATPAGACAGVRGAVLNWGYRNEPDVTVRLSDYGYEVGQVTTGEGLYDFRGLGEGYALLQPLLSDSQRQQLDVFTNEVAVRLRCGEQPVVNLGVYSGGAPPRPPASLTVTADSTAVRRGDQLRLHYSARNGLPTGISGVMITDLFPAPLEVVDVQAGRGSAEVLDGRMLALDVGAMASGEEVTATVTVSIDESALPGQEVVNRASLLYAESMADQVVTNLTVGRGVTVHNGEAGADAPAGGVIAPADRPSPELPQAPAPETTPADGGGEAGSPTGLPSTGANLDTLPALALGLTGLWAAASLIKIKVIG